MLTDEEIEQLEERMQEMCDKIQHILLSYKPTTAECYSLFAALYADVENVGIETMQDMELSNRQIISVVERNRQAFFAAVDECSEFKQIKHKQDLN
jgi:hypothetical protein